MSTSKRAYHHGDLGAALLDSARELLEEAGAPELSLRAVARRAGVSPAAPYRHYADREALLSAVAATGYADLLAALVEVDPAPSRPEDVAEVAVAYVSFALERPALFRVMFGGECDPENPQRVAATTAIGEYVRGAASRIVPAADPHALTLAVWALVHGLAFLCLDGKLPADPPELVREGVSAAVNALLD